MDESTMVLLTGLLGTILGTVIIGSALAGAYFIGKDRGRREAERALRAGGAPPGATNLPAAERTDRAIDALSLEVERLAEAQRYTAKLLADSAAAKRPPAS
jgi:hypothetical protein